MDGIIEKLKELGNKILGWWNRFTSKQKTLIVVVLSAAVLAIVIIVSVLTKPEYVLLKQCEDAAQAASVRDLLDEEGLKYEASDDGLTFRILKSQQTDAIWLLSSNSITTSGFGIDDVESGGFSSTESDRQRRYIVYMEEHLIKDILEPLDIVDSATVMLDVPENTGTLIDSQEEASATVSLKLNSEINSETAAGIARAVAAGLGNKTTDNIVILDNKGKLLFSGAAETSIAGVATGQLSVKAEAENLVTGKVKQALMGTNEFDNIEVATNLVLVFDNTTEVYHEYTPAEGQDQGVLANEELYESVNESGIGGVPGTDSNDDDTTYELRDNNTSTASVTESSRQFLPNERITTTESATGNINYSRSSISVSAINYNVINEEDVRAQGLLDGVTWEEYKLNNRSRTKMEVDEDLLNIVAQASGISASNIALVAYTENVFFDDEGSGIKATDVLQIVLIIVILGLLAFVVLRSMRGEKHEDEEEELSVENLLQSTPDTQLVDIAMEEETETAKLINKFVDENPEAVANLLRNWLNEDWG
ncbi:MAG: flagellar M-ring protein FliF [Butyrivibrio sp.]|nr:flagellar M-ring protein FliF [Butyrivibrio sp.]